MSNSAIRMNPEFNKVKEFIYILDPTAKTTVRQERMATGLDDLNGRVIGLVDNRKPNFDIFLERVEKALRRRFPLAEIIRLQKGGTGATVPMTPEEMERLAPLCDAVVYGVSD
ncbi:MAG: hypothetical protein P8Z37_04345 [Acidobacteriota bacterium]